MYCLRIGDVLYKVMGVIQRNKWLEWKDWWGRGDQGYSRPGSFCMWSERQAYFPNCVDEEMPELSFG